MKLPFEILPHLTRFSEFYPANYSGAPKSLFDAPTAPDLSNFTYPLPAKKSDFSSSAVTADGALWFGSCRGIARFDKDAEYDDVMMYFSAERDLPDNNVRNIVSDDNDIWALTDSGITKICLRVIDAKEKADILLKETLDIVMRRGMVSQRDLKIPGDLSSRFHYANSDNDGGFTACFAIGEAFRYAVLKREKGTEDPETVECKKILTQSVEACLLMAYIHGRDDGFVARSYVCQDEVVPDDGFFYKICGDKAVCLETSASKQCGMAGFETYAGGEVPVRLRHLYEDQGYKRDGIVYKADTSSDEITFHMLIMWLAHEFLGPDDPELDELIKKTCAKIMNHIIDHGFELHDCTGKATTWAKWSESYFDTPDGWVDACLNSAELLMYLRVAMEITGEQGRWRETYDMLVEKGYADLTEKHFDRMYQAALSMDVDYPGEIMYGDHMLCAASFYGLAILEKDEKLLTKYRNAYESWRSSMGKEYNPVHDFVYSLLCPDAEIDMEMIAKWFTRCNISRLASRVSAVGRHDVPVKKLKGDYTETGCLLMPDERFISKYDRNPLEYKDEDSGGKKCVESCYPYTFGYWMGRYYGFIK